VYEKIPQEESCDTGKPNRSEVDEGWNTVSRGSEVKVPLRSRGLPKPWSLLVLKTEWDSTSTSYGERTKDFREQYVGAVGKTALAQDDN